MLQTRYCLALASLAIIPLASSHDVGIKHDKRSSPLEVTLTVPESGSAKDLIATIKNVGPTDLNLLAVGTLLDSKLPVQKFVVHDDAGIEVPAKGIHPSIRHDALKPAHFQLLKAHDSVNASLDGTAVHDFARSGTYTFHLSGLLPLAVAPSTQLSGPAATFQSNAVSLHVEAQSASSVSRPVEKDLAPPPRLRGRTRVQDGCNATQLAASTAALENCQKLATAAAADAADPGSGRFVEYFGTNSSATRQTVVDRLNAVAKECSTVDSGASRYFCYDYYGACEVDGPLLAYTTWDQSTMVMCPLFYDTLPPLPLICHKQDQATTVLHEATHCEAVYSPHTNDFAYAYNESTSLPPEKMLLNADNYSLYANGKLHICIT